MDPVARTSLYTAVLRARESARSDRLFDDPLAATLAGPEGQAMLARMDAAAPGAARNPVVPVRTRFYDDTIERASGEAGVRQLVILAAGMDTRAYRLNLPSVLTIFELDRPEVLDLKAVRLAQADARPRCQRVALPVDLAGDGWSRALRQAGFEPSRAAVWLAEGLTPYLTDDQVDNLLRAVSSLASPGSWLLTDVFAQGFLTSPQLTGFRSMMTDMGSPLRFGTDDPAGLLRGHGWEPTVTRLGDPEADFGRWIMPEGYHDNPDIPHGYLVVARR